MQITPTPIKDCYIIDMQVFTDERGYFFEAFNQKVFKEATGLDVHFVQDNQSKSTQNVVRGLHIQRPPYCQSKLVRALKGIVLDVAVDVRKDSPTYGEKVEVELSEENHRQLFIPQGLLHGFSVISKEAVFFYKCDNYYHREAEDGVFPLDPYLSINWRVPVGDIILSDKDRNAQLFKSFKPILSV